MQITDFDFRLPDELIAQKPLEKRENSRMLCLNRTTQTWEDKNFFDIPDLLKKDDVLVLNNTKVFPARLLGVSETGAQVEIFLVKEIENNMWEALARPMKRLKVGKRVSFGQKLNAEVLEKTKAGRCLVKFEADGDFEEILDEIGKTPLPPYIRRERDAIDRDRERYQTVFARERGAIAAPTAGLHFTPHILEEVKNIGVTIAEITLHVGYGTFEPVRVNDLSEHSVSPEQCEISVETAGLLNQAKAENRRIIAIGTTTTRALESSVSETGMIRSGRRLADLTITPGYKFRVVDGLLTNFHLPQSSLLVLVSSFAGFEFIIKAYLHAVDSNYRFYSYGDCMLIL